MRHLLSQAGRDDIEIESAGTGSWHVGDPPDARATAAAAARGIALAGAAQQVTRRDFADYDLLVAMDQANARDLRRIAPEDTASKVVLLRDYDPEAGGDVDVPDPYYGGEDGFEEVLDIVERSCRNLLSTL